MILGRLKHSVSFDVTTEKHRRLVNNMLILGTESELSPPFQDPFFLLDEWLKHCYLEILLGIKVFIGETDEF